MKPARQGVARSTRFALTLGMALTLGACGLVHHGGSVTTGEKYQSEGQYRAAYIEAKKVLQADDKNGEAWLLLGQATLMLGNPTSALEDLDHARAAGVADAQWMVPVGQALLVTQQFEKLLKTVASKDQFPAAVRARIEVLRGDAQRGMNRAPEAKSAYERALEARPDDPNALVGLARLALGAKHPDVAASYVQKALASAPDSAKALVVRGDIAFDGGSFAAAESDYDKALAVKHPDWLPQDAFYARARLADSQVRQREYDKALASIGTLEKLSPQQGYPHYLHAVVLYQQGHLGEAIPQLQQVLKADPRSVPAQMMMGAVSYAQGNYAQAQMYLANVVGAAPDNPAAHKLLALTLYREGHSDDALRMLRPVVPGKVSDAALLGLLQQAQDQGVGIPGREAASTGAAAPGEPKLAASPELAKAQRTLAAGDAAGAIRLLEAMPSGGGSDAALERSNLLVMAYAQAGRTDDALKAAAAATAKYPQSAAAHVVYGTALIAAGQREKARSEYDKARELDPKNMAALMNLGNLDVVEKRYQDAAARYQEILKSAPKAVTAMQALARLAAIQGNNAEAVKWLDRAIAAVPASPEAYVQLAALYSRAGQFDASRAVAEKLVAAQPDNALAFNTLGAAELAAGHYPAALSALEKAVSLAPKVPGYRMNLVRAQLLDKNDAAARDNLVELVKADPGLAQASVMLAFLKFQDRDLNGALALAQGLQQRPDTKLAGLTLEGDLYMADKAWGKAADAYQRGLAVRFERPLVIKRFTALVRAKSPQPQKLLDQWLVDHPDDAAMRVTLAGYYLDNSQLDAAAAEYERVLKAYPSNVDALNNLAWIYTAQHNAKAVPLAEQAHRLAPTSAPVADTYGWALLGNDQAATALPILAKAAKEAPSVTSIQYHLAVAQARTGDHAAALSTLRQLLDAHADFADQRAARALYESLGGKPVGKS
ncbi:MAG TPA: XrtA/PEP-CTERM system TPR-repeat protein PrsT [Nevskiaceae bacterium]